MPAEVQTHYRACNLCEAICGLEIKTQGDQVLSIKGDKNDPFSKGYICPKGTAMEDIYTDPDRLRCRLKSRVIAGLKSAGKKPSVPLLKS